MSLRKSWGVVLVWTATLAARPLVHIVKGEAAPTAARAGESQVVLFTVNNGGTEPISELPYRISVNGKTLVSDWMELRPQWNERVTATWRPPAGAYEYVLDIDPDNVMGLKQSRTLRTPRVAGSAPEKVDPDRENPLGGSTKPRLALRSLRVEPERADTATPLEVFADMQLLGVTRRDGFTCRLTLEGPGYPRVQTLNLTPDGDLVYSLRPRQPGRYRLVVEVDPENLLGEPAGERADNRRELTLEVH